METWRNTLVVINGAGRNCANEVILRRSNSWSICSVNFGKFRTLYVIFWLLTVLLRQLSNILHLGPSVVAMCSAGAAWLARSSFLRRQHSWSFCRQCLLRAFPAAVVQVLCGVGSVLWSSPPCGRWILGCRQLYSQAVYLSEGVWGKKKMFSWKIHLLKWAEDGVPPARHGQCLCGWMGYPASDEILCILVNSVSLEDALSRLLS